MGIRSIICKIVGANHISPLKNWHRIWGKCNLPLRYVLDIKTVGVNSHYPHIKNSTIQQEQKMSVKGDIGVIGLAVMGQNLILNMNDNGERYKHYRGVFFRRFSREIRKTTQSDVNGACGGSRRSIY